MKRSKFSVKTQGGEEEVNGLVSKYFGIQTGTCRVTHLAIGHALPSVNTLKQAKRYIQLLEMENIDWGSLSLIDIGEYKDLIFECRDLALRNKEIPFS